MGIKDPLKHVQRLKRVEKPGQLGAGEGRIPPGQYLTDRFPVLHYGSIPAFDKEKWDFRVWGKVEQEIRWSFDQMRALPSTSLVADIHCVTRWSKLDTLWEGVSTREVMRHVQLKPEARFVVVHAEQGYTANLPLEEFLREENLFAWRYDGHDLTAEHGWPLRLVVPSLYFWKSAKWVRGLEFLTEDRAGFWERYGYHNRGNPWSEERFG
jgi:DMSO/TMAO reductase YedYZ molybdopterin-dependent catalytic subunit